MKILVIGNCQARPLARLLSENIIGSNVETIIIHLAKAADEYFHTKSLTKADWIISQATANNFEPSHLNSNFIKLNYSEKATIWPNIFFSGQQPHLRYLTHAEFGRISGPLDLYHDLRILDEWYQATFGRPFLKKETYPKDVWNHSIKSLREKERECDVIISDIISTEGEKRKLFHTFNHPTKFLLENLVTRILKARDLPNSIKFMEREPLDKITTPGISFPNFFEAGSYKGIQNWNSSTQTPHLYNLSTLKEAFFQAYENKKILLQDQSKIRTTPQI